MLKAVVFRSLNIRSPATTILADSYGNETNGIYRNIHY